MSDETQGMELWSPGADGVGTGMSNLDMSIEPGFEAALRAKPGKVFGRHAALEFNGHVWFDGENFVEQPWRYHVPREVFKAPTLRELMAAVNEVYGSD